RLLADAVGGELAGPDPQAADPGAAGVRRGVPVRRATAGCTTGARAEAADRAAERRAERGRVAGDGEPQPAAKWEGSGVPDAAEHGAGGRASLAGSGAATARPGRGGRMRYPRIVRAAAELPWAIRPAKMLAIVEVLELRASGGRF